MTEFEVWHLWMIACLIFFILEIFIPSFIMASIGIGCLLAFTGSLFSESVTLQIVLFSGGTLAGFIGVKPLMQKYMYSKHNIRTNYDGLVGRTGKVIETINPGTDSGCVAIDGDQWKAVSENDELIETGTRVEVTSLNSIVVTVRPLGNSKTKEIISENTDDKEPKPDILVQTHSKNSVLVGIGNKRQQINFDEIVCFYSNSKTTFLITRNEKEYIHDDSLEKLSLGIPRHRFFRVNRQFIVSRDIISSYKADENGKIKLELSVCNGLPSSISVSRLKAHAFRAWMKKPE